MSETPTDRSATCSGCGKAVECCCFCDQPECAAPVCCPCLAVDLREAIAQPHGHGG